MVQLLLFQYFYGLLKKVEIGRRYWRILCRLSLSCAWAGFIEKETKNEILALNISSQRKSLGLFYVVLFDFFFPFVVFLDFGVF